MPRPLRTLVRPALPAAVACGVALIVPGVTAPDAKTVGTAGSVVAKAAQAEGSPGGDQRYPVGSGAMEAARSVAVAHWGANPCAGRYTIAWSSLDRGTNATASWRNPTDAWNDPGANFDCRVDLNAQADFDYPKLCTVLTHEMGHLVGRQHDPNPGTLMSAYYTTPLAACQTASPAGAPAAPIAQPASQDADGIDIRATDEQPRRTLRRKTTRRTKGRYKTVRRCVLRKAASGKRVKRCRTVKVKVRAEKARTKAKTATRTRR